MNWQHNMHPELFVFMGLIASGKSTLARSFAERRGYAYYNSDIVRKEIAGIKAAGRAGNGFGQGIYSREFTRKTYDALLDYAAGELQVKRSVVLDASYSRRKEREAVTDLAGRLNAVCYFILCQCDEKTTRQRLAERSRDPEAVSDADYEIYKRQKESFEYPDYSGEDRVIVIDTEAAVAELLEQLESALAG